MIGNYPITWLVAEVLSVVMLVVCLFHAMKQPDAKFKVLLLLCFIFGAGVFEHVGVLINHTYSYDQHRILIAGLLPLSVLLIEAEIVYAGMILFDYLHMPKWTSIWVVGLFSVFMDFAIDPVFVNDQYLIDGQMSGQWNWVFKYPDTYFGIPFENFTGWIYMTGFYAGIVYAGLWLAKKFNSNAIKIATPILAGLFLIVPIMLVGAYLIAGNGQRTPELTKLVLGCAFPLLLMLFYRKRREAVDYRKDWVVIAVPASIFAYNIIVMLWKGISLAYLPVSVCLVICIAYLYFAGKPLKRADK